MFLCNKIPTPLGVSGNQNLVVPLLPITIGVEELASLLRIHPDHVYHLLKSDPDRLPPHVLRTKPKQRWVWILEESSNFFQNSPYGMVLS